MAKFTFDLEPLLRARKAAEDQQIREVGALEQKRRLVESRIAAAQHVISANKASVRGELVGSIDPAGLRLQAHNSLKAMRDAQRLVLELAGVHRQLVAARSVLAEKARDRRAIELLKERRFEAWKSEQDKREAAFVDELAVSAAARRNRQS